MTVELGITDSLAGMMAGGNGRRTGRKGGNESPILIQCCSVDGDENDDGWFDLQEEACILNPRSMLRKQQQGKKAGWSQ